MNTTSVYNQIADTYVQENEDRIHMAQDIKKFIHEMPQGAKLIDLGCGVGYDARDFKSIRNDLQIIGIDTSKEMLKKFQEITNGITSVQENMMNVYFEKESINGVWMNASILHLSKEEARTLLQRILTWLKPGGCLYLQVKEGEGEKEIPASKYGRGDLSRFYSFYKDDEISNILSTIGYNISEVKTESRRGETWIKIFSRKQS